MVNVRCLCARMRMHVSALSCVRLFSTPWTVAHQASLSMGSSNLGMELKCPASLTLAGRFFTTEPTGKPDVLYGSLEPGEKICLSQNSNVLMLIIYF